MLCFSRYQFHGWNIMIYYIFVRYTYRFACVSSRSISVPGANNWLLCPVSMTSLWHVIPSILKSRICTCTWEDIFFQRTRNSNRIKNQIPWNVSKLPSVAILVMANVNIYAIVSTVENYENRTVTPVFISNNSVQSTVTNNNSNKQTVIDLALMLPNSRITLFPYSNIQGNVTIIFHGTNDKDWKFDFFKSYI